MIEQTLHGLVVGLGKIRKDGSKEFHWLEKPIHNRIVSGGLDNYFMLNGSTTDGSGNNDDYTNRFLSNSYSSGYVPKNGLLQYIAIGTNGTPTNFNDSTLYSQVGGYSRAYTYDISPYWGNRRNDDDSISFRVQNTSVAVENDTTIKEIGWFEKYTNSDTYVMFSRVVLDTPINLLAGEQLTVVYQMNITYSHLEETETPQSLLAGLLDSDGNQLRGQSSYRLYFGRTLYSKNVWYLDSNQVGSFLGARIYTYNGAHPLGAYSSNGYGYGLVSPFNNYKGNSNYNLAYTTNSSWVMAPQFSKVDNGSGGGATGMNLTINTTNINSISPRVYVPGTYYRDSDITVSPSWPSMSSGYQDIYAIYYNGFLTRFGYMDTTDPSNPVWVPKPWRKQFGQSYKFTFRYKLSTADTVE